MSFNGYKESVIFLLFVETQTGIGTSLEERNGGGVLVLFTEFWNFIFKQK